jgi:hypothetical protein
MMEAVPALFGSSQVDGYNLPQSIAGAKRLLRESDEIIATEV